MKLFVKRLMKKSADWWRDVCFAKTNDAEIADETEEDGVAVSLAKHGTKWIMCLPFHAHSKTFSQTSCYLASKIIISSHNL